MYEINMEKNIKEFLKNTIFADPNGVKENKKKKSKKSNKPKK